MLQGGERCLFDKQIFYCFSVPEVAAQRGDVVSCSDFWPFGADDQGHGAAVTSAALRGDLQVLKDIFESNDCSIFISLGVGMEEANLPDVLGHFCVPRQGQSDARTCTPCCCGWMDKNRWRPSTLHSVR